MHRASLFRVSGALGVLASGLLGCGDDDQLQLQDIDHADGQFIAVGSVRAESGERVGVVLRSSDGRDWSQVVIPSQSNLDAVAAGEDRFVAVAQQEALWSEDGEAWHPVPLANGTQLLNVAWGAGAFVALTLDCEAFVSTDGGETWATSSPIEVESTLACGHHLEFVGGQFVLTTDDEIATSPDGIDWSLTRLADELDVWWIASMGDEFVAGVSPGCSHDGCSSSEYGIGTSSELSEWSLTFERAGGLTSGLATLGDLTAVVGDGILVRRDDAWVEVVSQDEHRHFGAVVAGDEAIVAVSLGGVIAISKDAAGNEWELLDVDLR